MPNEKIEQAATIALEAIRDAAPGLLTVTQTAEKVAAHADISLGTARKRVRTVIEEGLLLELKPWSARFIIELPGGNEAGVGPFYIGEEWIGARQMARSVITTDNAMRRPSAWGPGNTTYVADPEQIREYVQQLADEKGAKEDAEEVAKKVAEEAERKEIRRRFPDLNRTLRKVMFIGRNIREGIGKTELLEGDIRLSRRNADGEDITERRPHLEILAWGDGNVALLQSILEIGITAHIQSQASVQCKHCARRILHASLYGREEFWWHVDTTNASCGKDRDTKAEPDVPRETSETA